MVSDRISSGALGWSPRQLHMVISVSDLNFSVPVSNAAAIAVVMYEVAAAIAVADRNLKTG